jgi:hypothetical protein
MLDRPREDARNWGLPQRGGPRVGLRFTICTPRRIA